MKNDARQLERVKVRDLKPNPQNPRTQYPMTRTLGRSIDKLGVQDALLATPDGIVWDGNRRLRHLIETGRLDEEVWVEQVPTAQEALKRVRIRHSGSNARWDGFDRAVDLRHALDNGMSLDEYCLAYGLTVPWGRSLVEALQATERFGKPRKFFWFFQIGIQHKVDLQIINRLIDSRHLRYGRQVRSLPLILKHFKRPWESPRLLEDLWRLAVQREQLPPRGLP